MLQRIQSLWLGLSTVLALLSLKFPVFSGNLNDADSGKKWTELNALHQPGILILTVALAVASLMTIFLYRQRKLQLRITLLALAGAVALIASYHYESRRFLEGNFNLYAITVLALPVVLLLAARGIYKDEQLIRNADKLR